MQKISLTERITNENILNTLEEKLTLIDIKKEKDMSDIQMVGHVLIHGDELYTVN